MQKSIKTYLSILILIFISFGKNTSAQDCNTPNAAQILRGANVNAKPALESGVFGSYSSNLFDAAFAATTNQTIFTNTLLYQKLWIAGINNSGNKVTSANNNYSAGPIIVENGQASYDCDNFNRFWEVTDEDVYLHLEDFDDNGIIDNPISNIYAYPGQQNPFFENIHGFTLPNTPAGLAPFYDNNNDGIYNPEDGDFPLPESVDKSTIPSHMTWGIFNDTGSPNSQDFMNLEIQYTAWAFFCSDNEILNNSIFTSHKIVNRGLESLISVAVGVNTFPALGCNTDDYFGCAPGLNTYYLYNKDTLDGTTGCVCNGGIPTFCDNPPVQAVTFLNKNMHSFIYHDSGQFGTPDTAIAPSTPDDYYNYLSGRWPISGGVPITIGSNGMGINNPVTSFIFSENPNNASGWSMVTAEASIPSFHDYRPTAATSIGALASGAFTTIDMAYTFYQDETLNHLETVDLVYLFTPELQQLYDNQFEMDCETTVCLEDCVWPGDANRDSIVTGCDLLHLGLANGAQGTKRNTPNLWEPYLSENWNTEINGINLKHADCNGDSIVNLHFSDARFVESNLLKTYKTVEPIDTYPYGFELSFEQNINHPLEQMDAGTIGRLKILINQADSLFGLSIVLVYDTTFFSNFLFPYSFGIWEDNTNDYILIKEIPERGEIHLATVKNNGANGFTEIGPATGDIFLKSKVTSYALVETLIRIKNIKAILNDGTIVDYGAISFVASINNANGNGVILNDENLETNSIQIFPNPTTDILNIKMENPTSSHLTIFDIYGKKVLEKIENEQSEIQFSIGHFSKGVYFLKIEMEGKEFVHKFIKM